MNGPEKEWSVAKDRRTPPPCALGSLFGLAGIVQQREYVVVPKLVPALQEIQFHDKAQADDVRPERGRKAGGCFRGSAGGQQIIGDDHALPFLNGVPVDLKRVRAVL